jgi:hypothetical protein
MKLFLVVLATFQLFAQERVKPSARPPGANLTLETCKRECRCHELTAKIETAAEAKCGTLAGKRRIECLAKIPFHCDLIEWSGAAIQDWLADNAPGVIDDQEVMAGQCTIHCRLGHCRCDRDGPMCCIGHKLKDHEK